MGEKCKTLTNSDQLLSLLQQNVSLSDACPFILGTALLTHVLILSTLHQMSSLYSLAGVLSISAFLYRQT